MEEEDESAFPSPGVTVKVEYIELRKEDARLESIELHRESVRDEVSGHSTDGYIELRKEDARLESTEPRRERVGDGVSADGSQPGCWTPRSQIGSVHL